MNSKNLHCIGLMSGTSLDGLDIVYVKFDVENYSQFEILYADTYKYSSDWEDTLRNAIHLNTQSLDELDLEYGKYLAEKVNQFIQENNIQKVDFIASHGHTILHQPEKGFTLQIGNGQVLSDITNTKVVCDFRTQDVKLRGQGAPLVPIGDQLLFSNYDSCLNLGGFANISFEMEGSRIAFDICPVNIVLNHYARLLGVSYDDGGKLAKEGKIDKNLLNELDKLKFYQQKPPKSLGFEWILHTIFPIIDSYKLDNKTVLRTFVEHVSSQISNSLRGQKSCLITGGGVYNEFLISLLKKKTSTEIIVPNSNLIDFKEALIFGLLGLLKLQNKHNCLQSVTGASRDHSSGVIFSPSAKVK